MHAFVDYEDDYVQPLLVHALQKYIPTARILPATGAESYGHEIDPATFLPTPATPFLQWTSYERIAFPHLLAHPHTALANAYVIRKALIRKHFLSATVDAWRAKSDPSPSWSSSGVDPSGSGEKVAIRLWEHVPKTVHFEVDYAEFLDDALDEADAWDLKESWARGENAETEQEREWWILKPGMSDRGQGIRLFSTKEELQGIFDEWEEGAPDTDDDEDSAGGRDGSASASDRIMTSHLRHFIAQPYIHPPLLFSAPSPSAGRKFHLRVYVLAVGALRVYVYHDILALFAAEPYAPPWTTLGETLANSDLKRHLTNTCLQDGSREGSVRQFWDLENDPVSIADTGTSSWKEAVFSEITSLTSQLFLAAARTQPIHFQPLPNAFELFGLDFLVDGRGKSWLLEVNAFPDFRQTGDDLSELVSGLMEDVVQVAVIPFFDRSEEGQARREGTERLVKVLDVDLGRT